MKFYNRKTELKALEKWRQEKGCHLVVVYGKRRVGKTALCLEFAKSKPYIYYLSERLNPKLQLKKLSEEIGVFFSDSYLANYGFQDWEQMFRYLAQKNKKLVLIIDEFPYLVESDPAIPSIFQKGWDLYLSKSNVYLILCGSSIGMMEKHTLVYQAPLYGRRSGQILVKPFSYFDLNSIFPGHTFEQKLLIYSIAGGTITYLKYFIDKKDIWEVVKTYILSKEQFLYEEVDFLLREELREPRNYFSILLSLSLGRKKLSEIINETGFEKNIAVAYLAILSQLLITKKEVPITEKIPEKNRKGIYNIIDNYVAFWFQYVFRNRKLLEEGRTNEVLKIIKTTTNFLLSKNYEEIAKEIVLKNLPKNFSEAGRWWNKDAEIDVVGLNNETKEIIFGEAKWSEKKVGTNIYSELKKKSELVDWRKGDRGEYYILFSKSGFTEDMLNIARGEKVFLVEKDKILY